MNQEIFQFVQSTLKKQCLVTAEIKPTSDLRKDLGLDSVGAMTLMAHLEIQYKISFDVTMKPPQTVQELVTLIEKIKP